MKGAFPKSLKLPPLLNDEINGWLPQVSFSYSLWGGCYFVPHANDLGNVAATLSLVPHAFVGVAEAGFPLVRSWFSRACSMWTLLLVTRHRKGTHRGRPLVSAPREYPTIETKCKRYWCGRKNCRSITSRFIWSSEVSIQVWRQVLCSPFNGI